ncbi:hypothetical protein [Gordonia sp. VNK21]|uniref:hypothetical protein n=1 Tax=Gordonia sp. VNK21 TaxID=3382483 RepID=UPI0038D42B1D
MADHLFTEDPGADSGAGDSAQPRSGRHAARGAADDASEHPQGLADGTAGEPDPGSGATSPDGAGHRAGATGGPRRWVPAVSWAISAITVSVFFAIGAWQRRWIADDGLIVLRTLRNLLAGNGPVFNAGERVEANTSTAWTYLLWFWAWVTGGQLEYVALWVALVLSVAAIPLAMYGTARLYGGWRNIGGGITLLLPLGAVIYIALPPARDFATSGLENGLVIFWIAGLWCLFLAWARREPGRTDWRARSAFLALGFVAGLAPLIRPEITIFGGLVLLVLFLAPVGWWMRLALVVTAAVVPVGYQIFRMGYYAVLVPNPAIAKDASGSKWSQGWTYLTNLFGPYTLLLPVILAIVVGIALALSRPPGATPEEIDPHDPSADDAADVIDDVLDDVDRPLVTRWKDFSSRLQQRSTVVVVTLLAGVLLTLYWIRQGGDFMHGRVLLAPLFILLLPVMVVPATLPAHARSAFGRRQLVAGVLTVLAVAGTAWWGAVASSNVLSASPMDIGRNGIVDERRFYVANMANENPVTAEDYLDYPRMRAMVAKIDELRESGGIILPSGNYDEWYVAELGTRGQKDRKTTVYFLNLGMTSMNAPLDVRVVDQMGLAYPLAAHTERLVDGRIGHDKNLPTEWVVAESGGVVGGRGLPGYLDGYTVREAYVALTCPQTQDRFESYKDTWSFARFKSNLRRSAEFNSYRIARIPEYELARCGLTPPVVRGER